MGEGLNVLEIEITNRCNFNCLHCYPNAHPKHNDISIYLFKKILSEAKEMDVPMVILTGGEPTLHPEFEKMVQDLHNRNFLVTVLQTNGSLINEANCNLLKKFDIIQIGYDLPDHEIGVRRGLSDDPIKEKIRLLRNNNVENIVLFVTLHKKNIQYLEDFILRAESWNVHLAFNMILPVGRASNYAELLLSREDIKECLAKLWRNYLAGRVSRPTTPLSIVFNKELQEKALKNPGKIVGGCMAGITSLCISPGGDVMACPFLRTPLNNLRSATLREVWQHNSILKTLRHREFEGRCKDCPFINACGGCRARAYYSGNSLTGEDPLCIYSK